MEGSGPSICGSNQEQPARLFTPRTLGVAKVTKPSRSPTGPSSLQGQCHKLKRAPVRTDTHFALSYSTYHHQNTTALRRLEAHSALTASRPFPTNVKSMMGCCRVLLLIEDVNRSLSRSLFLDGQKPSRKQHRAR